jgi:hypothetical protein
MADDFKFQDANENKAGDGQNRNPELNLLNLQADVQQQAKVEQPAAVEKIEAAQAETFKVGDGSTDSNLALAETQDRISEKVTALKSSPEGTALLNDYTKSLASMMESLPKDDPRMAGFRYLPKEAISSLT